jgi:glycolate dehydrogenase iron-sulfur subunit
MRAMQLLTSTELRTLADDCVHCGFCLPACPTYLLWGREADSPRGRIYLMKASLEGRDVPDQSFVRHIDSCLGCMSCVTACPSGVQYDRLIEATRPSVDARARRSFGDRLFRRMLFALFPYPSRLRPLAALLRFAQRSGLQRMGRSLGLTTLLPSKLAALERLSPPLSTAAPPFPAVIAARGPRRRRVGMLLGCVQREFFPGVNSATVRVLSAEGCEVHVPASQGCCGALMLHSGLVDEAAASARRLIDAFDVDALDHIVINAAGCGSAMKEYGHLLRNDPAYAEKARAFAAKCVDVSELLADLEPRAVRRPLPWTVAYHDACHLQHAQRVKAPPRQVLATIPELDVREIGESEICCGSAGVYNLLEPDAAIALRDRKIAHVLRTGCDVVVSSNPGCLLQIASGLEAADKPRRLMHFVELVDAAISQDAVRIE